jgi:heme/copper-type cytochrome/quinol oxidase subunit 4
MLLLSAVAPFLAETTLLRVLLVSFCLSISEICVVFVLLCFTNFPGVCVLIPILAFILVRVMFTVPYFLYLNRVIFCLMAEKLLW